MKAAFMASKTSSEYGSVTLCITNDCLTQNYTNY